MRLQHPEVLVQGHGTHEVHLTHQTLGSAGPDQHPVEAERLDPRFQIVMPEHREAVVLPKYAEISSLIFRPFLLGNPTLLDKDMIAMTPPWFFTDDEFLAPDRDVQAE